MSITHVQGSAFYPTGGSGTSSIAVTLGATVGNGNMIVGHVAWVPHVPATDTVTITDDQSNTYTIIDTLDDTANSGYKSVSYYFLNITNAPMTITATFTTAVTFNGVRAISADEFSGIAASSALDGHNAAVTATTSGAANNASSGSITPTTNGDLLWSGAFNGFGDANFGITSGWNAGEADGTNIMRTEYLVQSVAASVTAFYSTSNFSQDLAFIAAFKAAPPPYIPRSRSATALVNRTIIY